MTSMYSKLTEAEVESILQHSMKDKVDYNCGPHGCTLSKYSSDKKNYTQVSYNAKKYYFHVLSAMRRYKRAPRDGEEVSHLCHQRRCVKTLHLCYEDGLTNKTRLCCQKYGSIPGYMCPHTPTCFGCTPIPTSTN